MTTIPCPLPYHKFESTHHQTSTAAEQLPPLSQARLARPSAMTRNRWMCTVPASRKDRISAVAHPAKAWKQARLDDGNASQLQGD